MAQSQQKQWFTDLLESLPSIVFILMWRQGGDLETAGWTGSALAVSVFGVMFVLKSRMHPVLLGVNLHLLLVTPLIVGLFRTGLSGFAELLTVYSHGAVLITVTLTGLGLTLFSSHGFAGLPGLRLSYQRRLSLLMLAISAAGAGWAMMVPEKSFLPVVVTLSALIAGRRYLLARWSDRSAGKEANAGNGLLLAGLPAVDAETADVSA